MEDLRCVPHDALKIDREVTGSVWVSLREDPAPEQLVILRELGKLLIQLPLEVEGGIIQACLQDTREEATRWIHDIDAEVTLELCIVQSEVLDVLSLNESAVRVIFFIDKLDQVR